MRRPNAVPLSLRQWSALVAVASRQLGWGLREVADEVRWWRTRARQIPDPALRKDALSALDHKRGHADGAALLWTLAPCRDRRLLRALVRYELIQDFLDSVTEPGGAVPVEQGDAPFRALSDALDPHRTPSASYRWCSAPSDGGYLAALVEACRVACAELPGLKAVRPLLMVEVDRASVLAANHRRSEAARDAGLRQWARRRFPAERELRWFELTAASSGWITTLALLAMAADAAATTEQARQLHAAYFPWMAMALTMLDSYADLVDDRRTGNHSYLAHYGSLQEGVDRLCDALARSARAVLALPSGERHAVLLASMIALYVSKDAARDPELRATTAQIVAAGGTLTRALVPALRLWRLANRQRATT